MKRIQAVLFDYGCVLSFEQVRREVRAMLDLTKVNQDLFMNYYYRYRLDYDAGISGKEYWQRVLSSCKVGYDEELISRLIDHDIRSWTALNQEALDWAMELKKDGYKLGVISNMPMDILRYMKENFSWLKSNLFNTLVFSCDLGICKPHPEIYKKCLTDLNLRPEECLFIDDSEVNIKGAKDIGLNAFHYHGPENLLLLKALLDRKASLDLYDTIR